MTNPNSKWPLTKRERFALAALTARLSNEEIFKQFGARTSAVGTECVLWADSTLEALGKSPEELKELLKKQSEQAPPVVAIVPTPKEEKND